MFSRLAELTPEGAEPEPEPEAEGDDDLDDDDVDDQGRPVRRTRVIEAIETYTRKVRRGRCGVR